MTRGGDRVAPAPTACASTRANGRRRRGPISLPEPRAGTPSTTRSRPPRSGGAAGLDARRDRPGPRGRAAGGASGPADPSGRRDDCRRQLQRGAGLDAGRPGAAGRPARAADRRPRRDARAGRRATRRAISRSAPAAAASPTCWSSSAPGGRPIGRAARDGGHAPGRVIEVADREAALERSCLAWRRATSSSSRPRAGSPSTLLVDELGSSSSRDDGDDRADPGPADRVRCWS